MSGERPDPFSADLLKVGRSAPRSDGRRKVHPLTPVVHAIRLLPVLVIFVVSMVGRSEAKLDGQAKALLFFGVILVVLLFGALRYLEWTRLTYWFDEDGDLRVDSGVLTRKQRRLQLSRLQSVDVVSPFISRLAGLAAVRVEVAGSHDSKAVLQFLTRTEASHGVAP